MPQGKKHWQETKSSSSVKGTVRLRQTCTAQVMSCIKNPPCPTHSCVLHLPGQPVLGQGARDLGWKWDSPPTPHTACKLSHTSSWDTGCEATCSRGCFAHSDKTYLGNKLGGFYLVFHSGSRRSLWWHNLEEGDQMLLLQERWQVKDRKNSRASPAAPAAHKPSTALRHSCHVCLV